jgi:hypothetical protein
MPTKFGFILSLAGALGANRQAALLAQRVFGENINRRMRMMGRPANVKGGRLKTSVTAHVGRMPLVGTRTLALIVVAFLALAVPRCCFAQVQLPAVNLGDTNFEDAFGGPGWLFQEWADATFGGKLKDSHGATVPGGSRIISYATTTHVVFVSKKRVFGGWLSAEAIQPLVDLDIRLANTPSSRLRGFADLILGAGLQWQPKKVGKGVFAHRFILDIDVPTGTYSDKRAVNIGNHIVSVNPFYAATYKRKKVEVSTRLHYLWNSANNDPFIGFGVRKTQPGQAFHINYATSYEVLKNFRIGFNGYWLQQITDHRINDLHIAHSRERTVGLGPGFQLTAGGLIFHLNGYFETDVRNRPSGGKVTFRISKILPAAVHQP